VFADNYMLHTVIRNILSNAVKFTPKGGLVTIQSNKDSKSSIFSITDNGIGMNSKMAENLFKLDVKTNRTGTEDEPSSGLGLILCKEFVEKHGGKIWVESEENKGTTFYCSFPFAV
jgi:signal transduction histidine kinase